MFLELLKNGAKTVVGVKQTQKAINNSKAKMVLIAVDADEHDYRRSSNGWSYFGSKCC